MKKRQLRTSTHRFGFGMLVSAVLLLAVASLAGCQKHDDDKTLDTWKGEIRLASGITAQTRANSSDVPDKQIAAGKGVVFYVDDAGTKAQLYEGYALTADGNGGFTKYNPQAEDMYYPATGNNVDIYAFLTDGFVSAPTFPTSPITHTVSGDQSVQHGDNYLASDLLYAANKGVVRSPDAVLMNFYHMLSKVEVALKAGVGAPDLTGAVVTIENTQLKADFLPDKTKEINGTTAAAQAARAAMVTLTSADNPATPIKIRTAVSGDFSAYASAVVVPQTVVKGKRFIKVTLASGGELYYTIPDADGLKLESGNKYQLHITVSLTGLTVKSTIADWATNVPIGGTAEMPGPIGSKSAEQAAVGDFYFSDGTLEGKDATLTDDQKAACLGVVFKVGRDADGNWKDECTYTLKDGTTPMSIINGYVLALYDANGGNTCQWGSYGTLISTNTEQNTGFYGYKNTNTIKAYAQNNGKNLQTDFPATYYATVDYETREGGKYAAPANSSGWFLPSAGQGKYLLNNKDVLLASVKKVTGQSDYNWKSFYWSSSESSYNPANGAWIVYFSDGNVYSVDKNYGYYVRSVFAF